MNKKLAIGGGIVASLLLVGACAGPTETTTATQERTDFAAAAPEPTSTWSVEDEFLSDVHSNGGSRIRNVSDEELLGMGYEICDLLDSGNSVMDLARAVAMNGTDDEAQVKAITAVIAGAVVNLCPEYSYQLEN